jgi:hypothetical protein
LIRLILYSLSLFNLFKIQTLHHLLVLLVAQSLRACAPPCACAPACAPQVQEIPLTTTPPYHRLARFSAVKPAILHSASTCKIITFLLFLQCIIHLQLAFRLHIPPETAFVYLTACHLLQTAATAISTLYAETFESAIYYAAAYKRTIGSESYREVVKILAVNAPSVAAKPSPTKLRIAALTRQASALHVNILLICRN